MPNYSCPRCEKPFKQRGDIRRHFLRKRKCLVTSCNISIKECFLDILGEEIKISKNVNPVNPNVNLVNPNVNPNVNPVNPNVNPNVNLVNPNVNPNENINENSNENSHIITNVNPNETTNVILCDYICKFCNKKFKYRQSKYRHENKSCKMKNILDSDNKLTVEEKLFMHIKTIEKEKEEMRNEIKDLIEKVGNTTNNNFTQHNIVINNYGNENMNHITINFLDNLLKIPYSAVPKLLEEIYFHPDHPENCNIKITNKKLNYAKVFKNNEWKIKDKNSVIKDMVDKGYNIIDGHFSIDNKTILNFKKKKNFTDFQKKYDNNDKFLHRKLEKNTEILVINNS